MNLKIFLTGGIKNNLLTYFLFLAIAAAGMWYGTNIAGNYQFLRVWEPVNLLLLLAGVPFLFFQKTANLPDFYEKNVAPKQRFLLPVLIGAVFGILDIFVFKVLLHPQPYTELPPFLQPFPYSVFLYFSGAFEVEVFYRLIPLTLILVIGARFRGGKYFTIFFWVAAVLTALREPLEQLPNGSVGLVVYSLLTGFLMNLLQAIWYRKAGFLASLTLRLGHYLFWHILLGVYVEFFELA